MFRGRGGFRGSSFRGRGGRNFSSDQPSELVELGHFMHECEGQIVCKNVLNDKIPYFNAPIFLQNNQQIGQIDEVFGPINEVYFTIACMEGILATSYKFQDKFYIGSDKLLPITRFTQPPARGSMRGGRGRGGRGGSFTPRGRGGFKRGGPPSFGRGGRGSFGGRGRGGPYTPRRGGRGGGRCYSLQ